MKITEIPKKFKIIKNGWYMLRLNTENFMVTIKVRPRLRNRLLKAAAEFPVWVGTITGQLVQYQKGSIFLKNPILLVREKKPKKK